MQTAVEWLTEKMKLSLGDEFKYVIGFFEQAKEMEKQQIINSFKEGTKFVDINDELGATFNGIIYYNETFKP